MIAISVEKRSFSVKFFSWILEDLEGFLRGFFGKFEEMGITQSQLGGALRNFY
jgi:hypothetical protein